MDNTKPPEYIPKVGDKVILTDEFLSTIAPLDAIKYSKEKYFIVEWAHLIDVVGVPYFVGRYYEKYTEK